MNQKHQLFYSHKPEIIKYLEYVRELCEEVLSQREDCESTLETIGLKAEELLNKL